LRPPAVWLGHDVPRAPRRARPGRALARWRDGLRGDAVSADRVAHAAAARVLVDEAGRFHRRAAGRGGGGRPGDLRRAARGVRRGGGGGAGVGGGGGGGGKHVVAAATAACWYVGIVATNADYAFTVTNVFVHGVPYLALVYLYARAASREPASRGGAAARLLD